jgi:hypothetical protein
MGASVQRFQLASRCPSSFRRTTYSGSYNLRCIMNLCTLRTKPGQKVTAGCLPRVTRTGLCKVPVVCVPVSIIQISIHMQPNRSPDHSVASVAAPSPIFPLETQYGWLCLTWARARRLPCNTDTGPLLHNCIFRLAIPASDPIPATQRSTRGASVSVGFHPIPCHFDDHRIALLGHATFL